MKVKKNLMASVGSLGMSLLVTFSSLPLWKCFGKVFMCFRCSCGLLSCLESAVYVSVFPVVGEATGYPS